ncbi:MAG TPA: methyltransferase [Acidimicrobiales bacterium]|nr:methyltransferase [Acidimicrobiales bacterium]
MVKREPGDVLLAAASFRLAAAIRAAVSLGVGEALEGRPRPAGEVAAAVGAGEAGTALLLRALAAEGVLEEDEAGRFSLGPAGSALLPAARGGYKELILGWAGLPAVYRALDRLDEGVRSGRPAFELAHGQEFFGWLAAHPDDEARYHEAVGGWTREEFEGYVDLVDLSDRTVVADIGGGGGGFLRALLARWPHLRGIVVELPSVAQRLDTAGPGDRISVHVADCRTDPLPAADCFLFSTVLRYFPDDVAAGVLASVRRASEHAVVVLYEMPPPPGPARAPSAMKSLVEFALTGGRDRTVAELRALFNGAGFDAVEAREARDPFWVVVARPS